jgi:Tol biopolymer transport system component
VNLLAFSPDGATLASWSEQDFWRARILLWDVASGTQKDPLNLPIGFALSINFGPDGQTLAVALVGTERGQDGVHFWNLTSREWQYVAMSAVEFGGYVSEVHFCSDGRRMAFYREEKATHLWDLDKKREQSAFQCTGRAKFPTVALRSDGKLAATGDADGVLSLWNPETGKTVAVVQASRRHIPYAYFSPDGRTMVTHEILESAVKIWDVPTLIKGK